MYYKNEIAMQQIFYRIAPYLSTNTDFIGFADMTFPSMEAAIDALYDAGFMCHAFTPNWRLDEEFVYICGYSVLNGEFNGAYPPVIFVYSKR